MFPCLFGSQVLTHAFVSHKCYPTQCENNINNFMFKKKQRRVSLKFVFRLLSNLWKFENNILLKLVAPSLW